jgi:hypothetical protein
MNSSLNVFDDGAVLLGSVFFFYFIHRPYVFKPQRFKVDGSRIGPPIEASSIDRTQQSRFT